MKCIEIVINLKGQATVQTKGFAGSSCQEASRLIEQTLGTQTSEQFTSEFYASAVQPVEQQQ